MSQQEEGWPLGLQPLNMRAGLPRNDDFPGSLSFNTLLTASPSSSTDHSFSSDIDTESTGSFFHDRSITLGSLIGASNILEFGRKSSRVRKVEVLKEKNKIINKKPKTWIFSLCSRENTDAQTVNNIKNNSSSSSNNNHPPSLAHFLAMERRAPNEYGRNQSPSTTNGHDDELLFAQSMAEPNSLFVNGHVAPPRANPSREEDDRRKRNEGLEDRNGGNGVQMLFSCMCG